MERLKFWPSKLEMSTEVSYGLSSIAQQGDLKIVLNCVGRAVFIFRSRTQSSCLITWEQPLPFSETQLHRPREQDSQSLNYRIPFNTKNKFLYCPVGMHGETSLYPFPVDGH